LGLFLLLLFFFFSLGMTEQEKDEEWISNIKNARRQGKTLMEKRDFSYSAPVFTLSGAQVRKQTQSGKRGAMWPMGGGIARPISPDRGSYCFFSIFFEWRPSY
jgi:hypothetical protein